MHWEENLTLTLSRSRSTSDHHLNKLGRPNVPNTTYQVPRSSAFWSWRRRFLKGFYHIWAWQPSWSYDQNILHKFWLTYHKESSHEIWVQLGRWFVRKLCFSILMGLHYEWPTSKLKGQRSTLTFQLTSRSMTNNDFGFNSIQKINFSLIFPFKCIRKQIWPWRWVYQGQLRIIIWTNLVGPTSPMLHTKSQGHLPSGSGEEDF